MDQFLPQLPRRRFEGDLSKEEVLHYVGESMFDPIYFCDTFLSHIFYLPIPWVHRGIFAVLRRQCQFLLRYGEMRKIVANFSSLIDPDDKDKHGPRTYVFAITIGEHLCSLEEISELDECFIRTGHYPSGTRVHMDLGRYTLIMLARGFSKTTVAGIAVPLMEILFQANPYTVYCSAAMTHSEMQLENVRNELLGNQAIRACWGELKPSLKDPEKWSGKIFETVNGQAMQARGLGSQIRGLLHNNNRPHKVIIDDLEDKESVRTEDRRTKTREWMYANCIPGLPEIPLPGESEPPGTITALGTLLHPESLLEFLKRDEDWTTVVMGVTDLDGDYVWPVNIDEKKDEQKKSSLTAAGLLHVYYMEYHNQPFSPETQRFKPEFFHYGPISNTAKCVFAIYIDPAISTKQTADHSVITIVAMDDATGLIWVVEQLGGIGWTERFKVDEYFRLHKKWSCTKAGIESVSYQRALESLLREEMFRKKYYFVINPVRHQELATQERILGILEPRYSNGYIHHVRRFKKLEAQLLDFRPGVETPDDYPDSLAGAIQLLEPFAAMAADEGTDLAADEFEPLEKVFAGEWRRF